MTRQDIIRLVKNIIGTSTVSGIPGADPFTVKLTVGADKPTGANVTPVTLGISFDYAANKKYIINYL